MIFHFLKMLFCDLVTARCSMGGMLKIGSDGGGKLRDGGGRADDEGARRR